MPSLFVHLALAGLLAAALLNDAYSRRAVGVVLLVTAIPDLDTATALWLDGSHRALLHNLTIPLIAAALLAYDVRVADASRVRDRFGTVGVRVAAVAILAYAVAGVALDLVHSGVNPFYPVHDQFYHLDGRLEFSTREGIVQTFVDRGAGNGLGSTGEVHMSSGVDPTPGDPPDDVERLFPVVRSGWELLLLVTGILTVGIRSFEERWVE